VEYWKKIFGRHHHVSFSRLLEHLKTRQCMRHDSTKKQGRSSAQRTYLSKLGVALFGARVDSISPERKE
jgi:hypothetical protein